MHKGTGVQKKKEEEKKRKKEKKSSTKNRCQNRPFFRERGGFRSKSHLYRCSTARTARTV